MCADLTENVRNTADKQVKLSVIVIAYNMARELPRTLLSLSTDMQNDLSIDDYEIIVVDNGSTLQFDKVACRAIAPNIKIIFNDPRGSISPVGAINRGLEEAKGSLIGVMIDGARMASPGLLSTALRASKLSPETVIGTLAFHLGHDLQMKSVHEGYNQDVEDELLKSVPWQSDGYRLFDISVLAGSSGKGWFTLPGETNALFMRREIWSELGGYDQRFQTIGGGQANHDMWGRACARSNSEVILLLGEATFHQFHGGVATNAKVPPNSKFKEEYKMLHGTEYKPPRVPFTIFGSLRPVHSASIKLSRQDFLIFRAS